MRTATVSRFAQSVTDNKDSRHAAGFPLVLLTAMHSTLSCCALPAIPPAILSGLIHHALNIASPANLVKLVRPSSSRDSSPGRVHRSDPFVATHPESPGAVVMIVAEIINILLAGSLLAPVEPHHRNFVTMSQSGRSSYSASLDERDHQLQLQAEQTKRLIDEPLDAPATKKLCGTSQGQGVLDEAGKVALRWWTELGNQPVEQETDEGNRRGSVFGTLGGTVPDEEIELNVAVLVRFVTGAR